MRVLLCDGPCAGRELELPSPPYVIRIPAPFQLRGWMRSEDASLDIRHRVYEYRRSRDPAIYVYSGETTT